MGTPLKPLGVPYCNNIQWVFWVPLMRAPESLAPLEQLYAKVQISKEKKIQTKIQKKNKSCLGLSDWNFYHRPWAEERLAPLGRLEACP